MTTSNEENTEMMEISIFTSLNILTNLFPLWNCILWNFVTRAGDELRNKSHFWVLDLHVYADGLGSAARVHTAVVHDTVKAVGVDDGRC